MMPSQWEAHGIQITITFLCTGLGSWIAGRAARVIHGNKIPLSVTFAACLVSAALAGMYAPVQGLGFLSPMLCGAAAAFFCYGNGRIPSAQQVRNGIRETSLFFVVHAPHVTLAIALATLAVMSWSEFHETWQRIAHGTIIWLGAWTGWRAIRFGWDVRAAIALRMLREAPPPIAKGRRGRLFVLESSEINGFAWPHLQAMAITRAALHQLSSSQIAKLLDHEEGHVVRVQATKGWRSAGTLALPAAVALATTLLHLELKWSQVMFAVALVTIPVILMTRSRLLKDEKAHTGDHHSFDGKNFPVHEREDSEVQAKDPGRARRAASVAVGLTVLLVWSSLWQLALLTTRS